MKNTRAPTFPLRVLIIVAAGVVASVADADELQAQFDAAIRAIETDRLRTARDTLQDLLAGNPSLHRARLELARVYYLSQDYAEARREAQRVLDDPNTPPAVRTTVLAFLAQIAEDEKRYGERHQWTPSIYGGLMYDSNVNIGPSRDVIDIGPLAGGTISPESQPKDDTAWVINPAISHIYNPGIGFDSGEHPGSFLWQTDASAYYRGYFDETDFNLGVLTLRTGPAWVVPRHWRAWIGLQGDQIWFGGDSLALFSSLNPGITWAIGAATEITVEGSLTDRHYWQDAEGGRDGWEKQAGIAVTRYFNGRSLALQAGAGYTDFDADEEHFGYSGPEVFGGLIVEAWDHGVVYGRVGYTKYAFEGTEAPFFPGISRDDDEMRYALGFQHDFESGWLDGWALQGSWVHTDNRSNVTIYEYDRDVANLGLARRF